MRYAGLLVLALAASCGAVDAADDEASETEQAVWDGSGEAEGETVVVHSGGLDSCWAGLCWPSSWPTDPGPGYSGDGPGPGGGKSAGQDDADADAGKPWPVPAPRDCTTEPTLEQCLACCDWNVDKVWGENCRRMPSRTKKQRQQKALCWERAEGLRGECQAACPRTGPIVTFTGAP
jgi:hypothetical protein